MIFLICVTEEKKLQKKIFVEFTCAFHTFRKSLIMKEKTFNLDKNNVHFPLKFYLQGFINRKCAKLDVKDEKKSQNLIWRSSRIFRVSRNLVSWFRLKVAKANFAAIWFTKTCSHYFFNIDQLILLILS